MNLLVRIQTNPINLDIFLENCKTLLDHAAGSDSKLEKV